MGRSENLELKGAIMPYIRVVLAVLLMVAGVSAADQKTIFGKVELSSDLTILNVALKEAALDTMLTADGKMTLFAPTDAAFKKLGEEQIKKIVADKELLKKILLAHIVPNKELTTATLKSPGGQEVNGFRISTAEGLKIGDAKLAAVDSSCSNGTIHTIDTVLIPK
jgi:uncharacterized surface protein with fasciclin (FAS1) repeats